LRRIVLVAVGALLLCVTVALALAGVVPDGAHAWHSIQAALNSAADTVKANGAHAWH
jgi:phage-related tail protein